MSRSCLLSWLIFGLFTTVGCERGPQFGDSAVVRDDESGTPAEGGAVSTAPVTPETATTDAGAPAQRASEFDWSPLQSFEGKVSVSCDLDYRDHGDGPPLIDFTRDVLRLALEPCAGRGVLRLRYDGRIDGGFSSLMERATFTADDLGIGNRVLDLTSAGGQVEDAIRTGDLIADSRWTIWVREGSICHSACVLILASGDTRMIAGQVGIHRIIRMSSTATTRAELNAELHVVYRRVREYLERNGAAVAVADLMAAVPNRSLRLLSREELQLYGLDGVNPAQDDLDRLRLMRKCGEDFVRRRDAFVRSFDRKCKPLDSELDDINLCGIELRATYGFPDATCPAESPFSEFNSAPDTSEVQSGADSDDTAPTDQARPG